MGGPLFSLIDITEIFVGGDLDDLEWGETEGFVDIGELEAIVFDAKERVKVREECCFDDADDTK